MAGLGKTRENRRKGAIFVLFRFSGLVWQIVLISRGFFGGLFVFKMHLTNIGIVLSRRRTKKCMHRGACLGVATNTAGKGALCKTVSLFTTKVAGHTVLDLANEQGIVGGCRVLIFTGRIVGSHLIHTALGMVARWAKG
jgi:hypothetical protein